jgi:hypothetical protein
MKIDTYRISHEEMYINNMLVISRGFGAEYPDGYNPDDYSQDNYQVQIKLP